MKIVWRKKAVKKTKETKQKRKISIVNLCKNQQIIL